MTNPNFDAKFIKFAPDAPSVIRAYRWPSNSVDLSQVVKKIPATCAARVITSDELPLRLEEVTIWPTLKEYLAS